MTKFEVYVIKDYITDDYANHLYEAEILFVSEVSSEIEGIIKASEWVVNSLDN